MSRGEKSAALARLAVFDTVTCDAAGCAHKRRHADIYALVDPDPRMCTCGYTPEPDPESGQSPGFTAELGYGPDSACVECGLPAPYYRQDCAGFLSFQYLHLATFAQARGGSPVWASEHLIAVHTGQGLRLYCGDCAGAEGGAVEHLTGDLYPATWSEVAAATAGRNSTPCGWTYLVPPRPPPKPANSRHN